LLCTEDDNSCYRNVCKMSVVSFALAVVFIIRHNLSFKGEFWPAITRQQIELESCSNPVMTSGVVWFRIKEKFFTFGWGGFGIIMGVYFLVNYVTTSSDPTRQYFRSQYCWILG